MAAPPALFSLEGRAAFVTGAGRGLGEAIAQGLAQAGARVALADIDPAVNGVVERLQAAGHHCMAISLDVRDEAAFEAAFAAASAGLGGLGGVGSVSSVGSVGEATGGIDIMVNNAALTRSTSVWSITADEWDDVLAVNLRGSFFGCRIAGRHMRGRGTGRIINIASIAGQHASAASGAHYAASKAGLLALTRTFAAELAPHNISVNSLAPSTINSPLLDAIDDTRRQAIAGSIPLGRFGEAEEVAAAVVYLASPAAGFITGATLDLNGGRLMR
jgi:3-oxoacyl-[acyl-carrier protein] reductase